MERTRASRYCQDPLRFPQVDPSTVAVLLEQVEEIAAVEQPQRLTFGKGVGVRAVVGRGYEDSQVRSLAHDRSVEIPDGIDAH